MNPYITLLGGVLIGLASGLLFIGLGRVAGVSGIAGGLLSKKIEGWQAAFVAGLVVTGAGLFFGFPDSFGTLEVPVIQVVGAGLLVGFGAKIGNGCTSGHGVCGNARLSKRSIFATITFISTGMITVALVGV